MNTICGTSITHTPTRSLVNDGNSVARTTTPSVVNDKESAVSSASDYLLSLTDMQALTKLKEIEASEKNNILLQ